MASLDDYLAALEANSKNPDTVRRVERVRDESFFTPSQGIGFSREEAKRNDESIAKIRSQLQNLYFQEPMTEKERMRESLHSAFSKAIGGGEDIQKLKLSPFEETRKFAAKSFFGKLPDTDFAMTGNAITSLIDSLLPAQKKSLIEAYKEEKMLRVYKETQEKLLEPEAPSMRGRILGLLGLD